MPAIKARNELAALGSIWNAGAMITTVCIGALAFKESVTPQQWCGITLALVACFLLK